MQFLSINENTKLSELSDIVGERNLEYILNANELTRTPNIGKAFLNRCNDIVNEQSSQVDWTRKISILNSMSDNSDVFEKAALLNDIGWKLLSKLGTFPGMLKIPESVELPSTVDIIGDNSKVSETIYQKAMYQMKTNHIIDPSIFNSYSTVKPSNLVYYNPQDGNVFQNFQIPWGEVTLYSSLDNSKIDFPVYPEEVSDGVKANYTQMPNMIYQYEPWQVYESSGPRSNVYAFDFHRDMWTGDHRDGKANELIRFCEACCFPEYNGSAVNTTVVTLLVSGNALITGVLTDVNTKWDGPLGLDGWYLHCRLEISITEVSKSALSYSTVKNKPLIG